MPNKVLEHPVGVWEGNNYVCRDGWEGILSVRK